MPPTIARLERVRAEHEERLVTAPEHDGAAVARGLHGVT
jgi:hypothetical protein